MFGILDRGYSFWRWKDVDSGWEYTPPELEKVDVIGFGDRESYMKKLLFVFLPSVLMVDGFFGKKILEETTKRGMIVRGVKIPRWVVQSNPARTHNIMDSLYKRVSEFYFSLGEMPKRGIVLGASIGCCQATRFAAEKGIPNLILAIPGDRLAECIEESVATSYNY